jgi:hypothetical protein
MYVVKIESSVYHNLTVYSLQSNKEYIKNRWINIGGLKLQLSKKRKILKLYWLL